jgi:hypothetical protein
MDENSQDELHYQYRNEYKGFHVEGSTSLYVPIYRVITRINYIGRVPIPLFDEFVCRMIEAGVTDPGIMAELLGAESETIKFVISTMAHNDYLYNDGNWHLSNKGMRLYRDKEKLEETNCEVELYYDGLNPQYNERLVSNKRGHLLSDLKNPKKHDKGGAPWENGLIIAPQTYPDQGISDHNRVQMVKAVTRHLSSLGHRVEEVREFDPLGTDLLYHEYLLLVYSSNDYSQQRYKFLALDICGDTAGPDPSVTQALLRLHDRGELDQRLWASNDSDSKKNLEMIFNALSGYERGGVTGHLKQISDDKRESRPIMNCEIRKKFLEALEMSTQRLDIVSPWISSRIVDDEFMARFRRLLELGVRINILYGIEEEPSGASGTSASNRKDRDRAMSTEKLAEKLRRIGSNYPVPPRIKHSNTHEKLLICDDKFLVIGSFNFLSYGGKKGPGFRHEGGLLVLDPSLMRECRKAMIDSKL